MVEQGIDERPARMAGRRVDDHICRLVDDDDVRILIPDRQGQRFGLRRRIDRFRDVDGDGMACFYRLIRLRCAACDVDLAVLDQPLDPRSRLIAQHRREEAIETNTIAAGGNYCFNSQVSTLKSQERSTLKKASTLKIQGACGS